LYSEKGAETQEIRGGRGNRVTVRLAEREKQGTGERPSLIATIREGSGR